MLVFGGRTDIEIIVAPALREFNYLQTAEAPLPPRHIGHDCAWLKERFPQSNIVWDAIELVDQWWEPHGDLADCQKRIQGFLRELLHADMSSSSSPTPATPTGERFPSTSRQQSILHRSSQSSPPLLEQSVERLRQEVEQELILDQEEPDTTADLSSSHPDTQSLPSIAIVTHENVLRVMFGVSMVSHCTPILASLTFTKLPVHSDQKHVIVVPSLTRWQLLLAKKDFVVILGCSDPSIFAKRVYHGIDLALNHSLPVVVVCAVAEYPQFRQAVKDYSTTQRPLSSSMLNCIFCDMNSKVTECNAVFSHALIEAHLRLSGLSSASAMNDCTFRVVTSDWHMPRALMAFRDVSASLGAGTICVPVSAPTAISDLRDYSLVHLREGSILATRIGKYPHLWSAVRVECARELFVISFMVRFWASSRMQNGRQETRDLLRDLIVKGGDSQRQEIANLIARNFQNETPLAMQALRTNGSGSTALHYAAEVGAIGVVSDLVYFWGADATAINAKGLSPIDLAKKEGHFDVVDFLTSLSL
jgi:broad specificity phosphatase PhoE